MIKRGHHDWSSASRGERQCYICLMWQHFENGRWEYQTNNLPFAQQEYLVEHERDHSISCDLILALREIEKVEDKAEHDGKGKTPEHIYLVWDKPSVLVKNYRKKVLGDQIEAKLGGKVDG